MLHAFIKKWVKAVVLKQLMDLTFREPFGTGIIVNVSQTWVTKLVSKTPWNNRVKVIGQIFTLESSPLILWCFLIAHAFSSFNSSTL